ncbi:hypothetical protein JT362_01370 [Actinophytocola sp. S1-96]|uniref:HTH-like domain-containing protein n=1 Tax=Actinophytocola gossypii TaxID=2812003 RepID=A0ABT2J1N1_9PSEU|nr:hypothetical protein [Actinophytocola gossypii]
MIHHKRVARVMRGTGLAGLRLRRRHRTTLADPAAVEAPDLLGRDFTAQTPNTRYVGDITYLPIADGTFLYLATVMDLRRTPQRAGRGEPRTGGGGAGTGAAGTGGPGRRRGLTPRCPPILMVIP